MDKTSDSDSQKRIASLHLKHLMEYATLRGVPEQQMINEVPYSTAHVNSETTTVLPEEFYAVLDVIDRSLEDDLIGIRAGRFLNLRALGLIYRISLQATTIEEAFFYLRDYLNTTFPILTLDTVISDPFISIHVTVQNDRERLKRIILENVLTVMGREIKMMTGERTGVDLFSPFHTPDYPQGWSVREQFGLRFKTAVLQASMKDKTRLHLDLLIPDYLKLVESLKADGSFVSNLKIAALNLAGPELPDLNTVADSFNLTPRTLQRRLQSENSSYRQVVGELKQKISNMLLLHKQFSITDISYVLGYSEPAGFIHTFKKWHGMSPREFRLKELQ